jgi:hypothetical protein
MADDSELNTFFMEHGFIKVTIDDDHFIDNTDKQSIEQYIETLPHKKRQHLKKEVLNNESSFKVSVYSNTVSEIEDFYLLYKNVKETNLGLNSFPLPFKLFNEISKSENWEIIKIEDLKEAKTVSVMFCLKTENNYCPVIIGMDYSVSKELNIYKQSLFQVIKRGLELKSNHIQLGITASETKRKLGIDYKPQLGFVQIKDKYNMDYIDNLKFAAKK